MKPGEQIKSEKPSSHPQSAAMYANYAPNRMQYPNTVYHQVGGQGTGVGVVAQNQMGTMHHLKSNLSGSAQGNVDLNGVSRATYSGNPLMVLPTGQTVPLSAFYGQQQNLTADQSSQLQYVPTGMFPNFVGGTNMVCGTLPSYAWPYGMPGEVPGLDPNRRSSWSSNDETGPLTPVITAPGHPDYYGGLAAMDRSALGAFPYVPASSPVVAQQYITGPIQQMKCPDNKSYEMQNLDELTQRDPPIPRAVPALWTNQDDLSLAKCLQNPEGITNIYIRGFMPDTTDEDLHQWASRFGEIESCKAIIDMETNKCKGFGFVMYYSPASAENCIRGFFHLGFQASYAQKSRNSRLKDLEDKLSTNIYCTGVPVDWNEADLGKHFLPYQAISTKICREPATGVSKEVGFARFETREMAERVVKDFHSVTADIDNVKLYLRFADTKAQKQLKQESQKRRTWRSHEYAYSVENTPSPILSRMQNVADHFSPASHNSYQSPAGASTAFTPATSVSPPEIAGLNKAVGSVRANAWPSTGGLQSISNTPSFRSQTATGSVRTPYPDSAVVRPMTTIPSKQTPREAVIIKSKTPSPQKVSLRIDDTIGKENIAVTPQSAR